MALKSKIEIVVVCDKCGNHLPVDKERSNENWVVYKNDCECGGKGTPKIV